MNGISVLPIERYGYGFVPPEFLPPGRDEYWRRNEQAPRRPWRGLTAAERNALVRGGNECSDWSRFLVCDPFDPHLIRGSVFHGLVRLGPARNALLRHHDFSVPAGIRNSRVISCDIGSDTAIQDCAYLSHYIIGDRCILSRIDEMQTTNHAKFGSGALKDGEDEEARVWINVMNEAGGRSILPFADMLPADAFLWAAFRDDAQLALALKAITQKEYGGARGAYGTVGSGTVIKSAAIIKDAAIGNCAYIKGVNKLKNITVLSSEEEPSQIGEGVEMVNGIVGYGCRAFYGVKAIRFVMGRGSSLKYGARLIHSVLGDNSTISCCELLNNLVFPVHEQHHNNSFLIAGLIQGMSNIAAGATIGSNHNSRANDGEFRAGRGFWPGLSVTLKHPSRVASFCIIAKGSYPGELNITLPFSLVSGSAARDRLEVLPAYFWLYNLYALERNTWKSEQRDKRVVKKQRIEMDYLAPDTVEEIFAAIGQMEGWAAEAGVSLPERMESEGGEEEDALPARGLERGRRETVILKPGRARLAYRGMLRYYAVKTAASYLLEHPEASLESLLAGRAWDDPTLQSWVNMGGQLAPEFRVDELRRKIREGEIASWDGVHAAYDEMAASYPLDKARHALGVHFRLAGGGAGKAHPFSGSGGWAAFREELRFLVRTGGWIARQVSESRAKDFANPFRSITFRNREEQERVAGNQDNGFAALVRERTERFAAQVKGLMERG
ncbi:MAG: DUF4954 family protein [Treponematales bacterium]